MEPPKAGSKDPQNGQKPVKKRVFGHFGPPKGSNFIKIDEKHPFCEKSPIKLVILGSGDPQNLIDPPGNVKIGSFC